MTGDANRDDHRIVFTSAAADDIRELHSRSPAVAVRVLELLKGLGLGAIRPTRLRHFGKTGDLSDCGKIPVIVEGAPEHRIVVRDTGDGQFIVVDVVAVEERAGDLAYLLTALRLDRLSDPLRRSDVQRRVARILAARRGNQ